MKLGFDIASVDRNKLVDYIAAKGAGLSFAIFRGTYSTWPDPTWPLEAQRARDAGLTAGVYAMPDYRVGTPSPEEQMQALHASAILKPGDFPPVLDVEFGRGIAATGRTRRQLLEWILRAAAELERLYGVPCMIYTSTRVMDGEDTDALDADEAGGAGLDLSRLASCPLWLARYPWPAGVAPQTAYFDGVPWPPTPKIWGGPKPGTVIEEEDP